VHDCVRHLKAMVVLTVPWVFSAASSAPQESELRFIDSGQALGDSRTFRVAPGDLDGDGDQDVLVMSFHGPSHLWTNDGGGRFTDSGQILGEEGGHGAAIGDLDGDSDPDVYMVHNGHPDRIFLNDGRGTLVDSGQRLGGEEEWGTTVALGDVDNDGDLDAYGSGIRLDIAGTLTTRSRTEKTAVLAPMPRANVTTVTRTKRGLFARPRAEYFRS